MSARLLLFWDSRLAGEEKQMWLNFYTEGCLSKEELYVKLSRCGKIAIITNTEMSPEQVYNAYKSRAYIEECIERFKDTLQVERTYMRSDEAISGYFFVATLALRCHYWLMQRLQSAGLLSKHSVCGCFMGIAEGSQGTMDIWLAF